MKNSKPKKIYIIQENGYEYNDEYYYRYETCGGNPQEAYVNLTKAKQACLEKNINAILNKEYLVIETNEFPFNKEVLDSFGIYQQEIGYHNNDEIFDCVIKLLESMTPTDQQKIVDSLTNIPYELVEVELQ